MLNKLRSPKTKKKSTRLGRGYGSGGGHTVGRGMKGQKSRAGYSAPRPGFEGGQMPLSRRLPKLKGFTRAYYKKKERKIALNLSDIEKLDTKRIDIDFIRKSGLFGGRSQKLNIKILGDGEIKRKVEIVGIPVSGSAKKKIEKAGGKIIVPKLTKK